LIENDAPVTRRIEESARIDVTAAAGTAVHEQSRLPQRIAALLVVHLMSTVERYESGIEGLDWWIEFSPVHDLHRALRHISVP
jgi:hypothetical protein